MQAGIVFLHEGEGDRALVTDAFVLAGGASLRMGSDKSLLRFQNATLIERTLQLLRSLGMTPRIVGDRPDLESYAPVIRDRQEQCGPLSGIEAGLLAAHGTAALFLPVDLPLMQPQILRLLLTRAALTEACATIPVVLGRPQPLSAIYDCALAPAISEALAAGDYKVMRVIERGAAALGRSIDVFHVETMMAVSGANAGPPGMGGTAFLNCNRPDELARAERISRYLNVQTEIPASQINQRGLA